MLGVVLEANIWFLKNTQKSTLSFEKDREKKRDDVAVFCQHLGGMFFNVGT